MGIDENVSSSRSDNKQEEKETHPGNRIISHVKDESHEHINVS